MSTQAELRQRGPASDTQEVEADVGTPTIIEIEVEEEYTVFGGSEDHPRHHDHDHVFDTEKIESDLIATGGSLLVPATIDVWAIIRKSAINLVLPFINGMMLGFGEILAHEIGFKYHWLGAKVVPVQRKQAQPAPRIKSNYI